MMHSPQILSYSTFSLCSEFCAYRNNLCVGCRKVCSQTGSNQIVCYVVGHLFMGSVSSALIHLYSGLGNTQITKHI